MSDSAIPLHGTHLAAQWSWLLAVGDTRSALDYRRSIMALLSYLPHLTRPAPQRFECRPRWDTGLSWATSSLLRPAFAANLPAPVCGGTKGPPPVCGAKDGATFATSGSKQLAAGEKPPRCDQCTEEFAARTSPTFGWRERAHSEEQPFGCAECGKRFVRKSDLKVHRRTHTGERPFVCTQCSKRFTHSSNLRIHLRIHSGERPYSCTECPKRFFEMGHLKIHGRIHTGEKPFACTECPKRFTQSCNLRTHLRTHTGERPYGCPECPRRFSHTSSLQCHRRAHSRIDTTSSAKAPSLPKPSAVFRPWTKSPIAT